MTTSALLMLVGSWGVITYYTVKLFLKVLRTPQEKETHTSPLPAEPNGSQPD